MRRILALGALGLTLALAPACSDDEPKSKASPTYELPPRPVRANETPIRPATVRSGELAFTVIGLSAGLPELVGSHADVRPEKGQFVRIRLVTENKGRTTGTLDTRKQLLVTTDGQTHVPERQAMLIKRQPYTATDIGSAVRIELDLWYDIPAGVKVKALRCVGTPPIGAESDPTGIDVPLA